MALGFITDKTSDRGFVRLWFVRLSQMLVTIIILGIAASNASDFSSIGCSVPGKLGYNIAAAVLSFIVLLVLIFSSGLKPIYRTIPWSPWGQLLLDAFMFIIWIAAAGVSQYNCNDLCNACSGYDEVWADNLDCYCSSSIFYKRDYTPAPKGLTRSIEGRAYHSSGPKSGKVAAKIALDSIMVASFALTTVASAFWIIRARRAGAAGAAPPAQSSGPGSAPMANVPDNSYTQPPPQGQPDADYANTGLQQGQYASDKPTMQQTTYPNPGVPGAAGEYYQPPTEPEQDMSPYPPNHHEMQSHPTEYQSISPVPGH